MNSNDEALVATVDIAMEFYNDHPPSQEYVKFLETTLLTKMEALAEALQDKAHVGRGVKR